MKTLPANAPVRRVVLGLVGIILLAAAAAAAPIMPDAVVVERRLLTPRDFAAGRSFHDRTIGLALSGGGARGIAQLGVLKAFDEAGLPIDCIAGSSMGSIIGGLYASGHSVAEIEAMLRSLDFASLFSDSPRRRSLLFTQRAERDRYLVSLRFDGFKPYWPRGLAAGQQLTMFLTDLTIKANYRCGGDFDFLPIRFRAVATDIGTGERVALSHGSLADAMRASMAFPLAFTAVESEGRHLMDGGIIDPIPVDVCRDMGADYVVAVNTTSALLPAAKVDNPIDIANQVTTIMSQDALAGQLRRADLVITPHLAELESFDFNRHDTLEAMGYQAGRRAIREITAALMRPPIDGIPFLGVRAVRDDSLLQGVAARFPLVPGRPYRTEAVEMGLRAADPDIRFHRLYARLEAADSGFRVILDGERNRTGDQVAYRISGCTVLEDTAVAALMPRQPGAVLSLAAVKQEADSAVAMMHQAGYDLACLRSIDYDDAAGVVQINFDEGRLCDVDVRGNERTRSWYVRANFSLRRGEPYGTRKAKTGLANIFGTGFFERVALDVRPSAAGARLTILVKEKKFTQFRLGAHWDDEYQGEMFVELLDDNIFGAGIQAESYAQFSSRREKYQVSVKADRLSKTLITAHTRFYYSRLERRLFYVDGAPSDYRVEERWGGAFVLGEQIARLGAIYSEYRLEKIKARLLDNNGRTDEVLSIIALNSSVETIDRYPFPDHGHRQDLSLEFSGSWLGGTYDEYSKFTGSIEAWWPLGNYFNLHPRIAAGISTANLPDVEKFFLGGLYSFSGYRTDQLNGDKFLLTNLQLRVKLPYRLYLIGNFDWGNVFNDYENFRMSKFRKGWGAALAVNTPIGPIDFGYGKAEKMPYRLYLNVGLKF